MKKAQREHLATIEDAAVREAIERLDKAIHKVLRAETNFSAAVLDLVRMASSATDVVAALTHARAFYATEDAAYNRYTVALSRVRGAFRRVTGENAVEAWNESWDEVLDAAEDAENFTRFERGDRDDDDDDAGSGVTADVNGDGDGDEGEGEADEGGEEEAEAEEEEEEEEGEPSEGEAPEVPMEDWGPLARARYNHFRILTSTCVAESILLQAHADDIMRVVHQGILVALQGGAETIPSWLQTLAPATPPSVMGRGRRSQTKK